MPHAARSPLPTIDGLTLENRIAVGKAIPDDVITGRDNGASTDEFAAYVLEMLKKIMMG